MARAKNKTRTLARAERMAKALKLREGGATYQAIADNLGISLARAYQDVKDGLADITREPAEHLLTLELERIDRLWTPLFVKAVKGDMKATDRLIRLMDQRAKLLGLYRHEVNVSSSALDAITSGFEILEGMKQEDLDPDGEF
ncbi:hypothetical protein HMPREF2998_00570 [Corynebacterium sp. HMSC065A05]|uniref:hypothetical protein n=1 Tax=Corynebacterium sp. HMSC065A05 TaxID=1739502 RepID=UPI0008A57668|nr:hypothetical protein [Corynebacterium sp. HMSC065A05]OFP16012.1 hypothetical protein HMPREF2998_00570 [Corynebacterium sp. HMSC065A05]